MRSFLLTSLLSLSLLSAVFSVDTKKITELPAAGSLTTTDIFPVVLDPSGSAVTKKATLSQMLSLVGGTYLTSATAASTYQPLNANLTSIGALANSSGVLTNNGSGTLSYTGTSSGGNGSGDNGKLPLFVSGAADLGGPYSGLLRADGFLVSDNGGSTALLNGGTVAHHDADTGFTSFLTFPGNPTGARNYTLPNATGTIALTSDLASYLTTAAASSGYQPLDSDLTSIAALTTTAYGRSLLTQASAQSTLNGLAAASGTLVKGDILWYDGTNVSRLAGSGGILANVTALGGGFITQWQSSSTLLDNFATSQGSLLYRNASEWVSLSPGTSGDCLISNGAGANPSYATREVPLTFSTGLTRTTNTITVNADAGLPTQTGNSGKYLTTNGTTSSWASVSAGKILQVVPVAKTDTSSVTGTTPGTVMSASITPTSSSSHIMVVFVGSVGLTTGNEGRAKLQRGSTDLIIGDAAGSRARAQFSWYPTSAYGMSSATLMADDTPATTSATTYNVVFWTNSSGTAYLNRSADDSNGSTISRGASMIYLIEYTP